MRTGLVALAEPWGNPRSTRLYIRGRMRIAFSFLLAAVVAPCFGQAPQKGRFEVQWGWNRDVYSTSDIRFSGTGYDFTLRGVRAVDRPMAPDLKYLAPAKLTLPQTNLRLHYAVSEHYAVGLAFDHMKYVMVQDQVVRVEGDLPDAFDDRVASEEITLSEDFLTYEHTDGLNFVNARVERRDRWLRVRALRMDAATMAGLSAGVLVPRTACRLPGKDFTDEFHLSGFGTGLHAGARLVFLDCFVITGEVHGGRIWMPDVRTSSDRTDRASQAFWFAEGVITFGASFRLFKAPEAAP